MNRYQKHFVAFLLLCGAGNLTAQGQEAPLSWQFYGDFDSNVVINDDSSVKPTWSLQQNHASLLLSSRSGVPVSVMVDALHPADLFQFTLPAAGGTLTLGRILVPFGSFDFHHIYGGRQDDHGTFLPKLWSDIGAVYSPPTWGPFKADLFVTNGMDPSGFAAGGATPRLHSVGTTDSNRAKALGFRVKADLMAGFWLAASGSWDPYDPSDDPAKALSMGGLDGGLEIDSWAFKAGGIVQAVQTGSPYLRWADYFEAKWMLDWTTALRFRGGQMDTNSLFTSNEDQANLNVGILWHFDLYEVDLVYFRNFTLADPSQVGRANDYHQVLVKVLVAF